MHINHTCHHSLSSPTDFLEVCDAELDSHVAYLAPTQNLRVPQLYHLSSYSGVESVSPQSKTSSLLWLHFLSLY